MDRLSEMQDAAEILAIAMMAGGERDLRREVGQPDRDVAPRPGTLAMRCDVTSRRMCILREGTKFRSAPLNIVTDGRARVLPCSPGHFGVSWRGNLYLVSGSWVWLPRLAIGVELDSYREVGQKVGSNLIVSLLIILLEMKMAGAASGSLRVVFLDLPSHRLWQRGHS
jgi:hypothetical protein